MTINVYFFGGKYMYYTGNSGFLNCMMTKFMFLKSNLLEEIIIIILLWVLEMLVCLLTEDSCSWMSPFSRFRAWISSSSCWRVISLSSRVWFKPAQIESPTISWKSNNIPQYACTKIKDRSPIDVLSFEEICVHVPICSGVFHYRDPDRTDQIMIIN